MTTTLFPGGRTLGGGAFRVDDWIGGSRFLGVQVANGTRVHVTHIARSLKSTDALRETFAYDVQGVAKCLLIGGIDGQAAGDSHVVLVEELPNGKTLLDPKLEIDRRQQLQIATALAKLVASATRQGVVLAGIVPDLVFINRIDSSHVEVGLVPRSPAFIATLDRGAFYETWGTPSFADDIGPFGDPAMLNPARATPAADVYCLGLVIAFLYERKHPFSIAAARNQDYIYSMEQDERDPFTGPADVGRVLDQVLLADPTKRMPIDEVVRSLEVAGAF